MARTNNGLGYMPSATRLDEAFKYFQEATAEHVLTVIKDDGVYRRLRVGRPGTGIWHWEVVTWPGHLAIVGDVADGYVFSRVTDMLDFFRSGSRDGRSIDFRYWAEKVQGRNSADLREFSHEAFLEAVHEDLFENSSYIACDVERDLRSEGVDITADAVKALREEIWAAALDVSDPYGQERTFYEWLAEYEVKVPDILQKDLAMDTSWTPWSEDYYEMSIDEWSLDFLIACWALALTVKLWDAHVAENGAADGFTIVEGGIVQNDPGSTPVYDLDCLHDQEVSVEEIDDLFWRMFADPNRSAVRPYLARVLERLEQVGQDPDRLAEAQAAFTLQGRVE